MKVLCLVNNDAINDTRVVKTATMFAQHGHECTIIGCSPDSANVHTFTQNDVRFIIVPLLRGPLFGVFAGLMPKLASRVRMRGTIDKTSNDDKSANLSEATPTSRDQSLIGKVLARLRYELRRILQPLRVALHPQQSRLGVKALFGSYLWSVAPYIKCDEWQVVYCHELWMLEAGIQTRALAKENPLVVYDSHELEIHRNNNWAERANETRHKYERKLISKADLVITVCDSIAEFLARQYKIEKPLVLPNAPLVNRLKTLDDGQRLRSAINNADDPLLVYTGKVTIGRGLTHVVRLLAELDQIQFAMVGPAVESVRKDIQDYAQSLGVLDRVHFVERVDQEILVSFISDADIAVVPIENVCLSYYYSLPNKVFEAAMAGIPVLASDFPELEAFVNRYQVGRTVDFTDPIATQKELEQMIRPQKDLHEPSRLADLRDHLSFENAFAPIVSLLCKNIGAQVNR